MNLHPNILGTRFNLYNFPSSKLFTYKKPPDPGVGVFFAKGISSYVDWQLGLDAGFTDSALQTVSSNKTALLQSDFLIRVRVLQPSFSFQPFLFSGGGVQLYGRQMGLFFPIGIGLQQRIAKEVFLLGSAQYRLGVTGTINNQVLYSIGIAGLLKKAAKKTKSVSLTTVLPTSNPPVTRDTDKDGIPDSTDYCPDQAGMTIFNGCPDSDRDGIPDHLDECPGVAGDNRFKGCPIADNDADGLNNEVDSCIDIAGPIDNKGCPIDTTSVIKKLVLLARNIQFETGSARLLPESLIYLDLVVAVLQQSQTIKLSIEGHTDNSSTIAFNQKLSEDRAFAVLAYLVKNGIDRNRLSSKGWGQSKPVSDNNTREGRAVNRRVELMVRKEPFDTKN